jgi:hypothetical protein
MTVVFKEIGSLAVQNVINLLEGKDVPEKGLVQPALLTGENLDSPVVDGFWHLRALFVE